MSAKLHKRISDPDILIALQPEELGLEILKILAEEGGQHLLHNFNNEHNQMTETYPKNRVLEVQKAISEAWAWLELERLLAEQPGSHNQGWQFVTRRGQEAAKSASVKDYMKASSLPKHLLHPHIADKVWSTYMRSEYDTAVFLAFKEVEIVVRRAAAYEETDTGVPMMRRAFQAEKGPLADKSIPVAEQEALQALFAGALGSYKNPHSHRTVALTDPQDAAEMIILASHLFRIAVERIP